MSFQKILNIYGHMVRGRISYLTSSTTMGHLELFILSWYEFSFNKQTKTETGHSQSAFNGKTIIRKA